MWKVWEKMYKLLKKVDIAVESFVVSNNQDINQDAPLEVKHIADIYDKEALIIVALAKAYYLEDVKIELEKQNISNVIFVDNAISGLLS